MKVLVSAGATMEAIDPVRYITNHSTGKMGFALAKAAMLRGASVTVVKGHTEAEEPHFVKMVPVKSAQQMFEAVKEEAADADIVIMAAAVADYRPSEVYDQKVKKIRWRDEHCPYPHTGHFKISWGKQNRKNIFMWIFHGNGTRCKEFPQKTGKEKSGYDRCK